MKKAFFQLLFLSLLTGFSCVSPIIEETVQEDAHIIVVAKENGDFSTIQDAVDASKEGMTIRIRAGIYYESVTIATPGITIEAYDPVTEPVYIDGADENFYEEPPLWSQLNDDIYLVDYDWPLEVISDNHYTKPGNDQTEQVPMFMVYEDGELLRGYRNPYQYSLKNKNSVLLYNEKYGLAGMYQKKEDVLISSEDSKAQIYNRTINIPGRFYYDQAEKKLYVQTADKNPPSQHEYHIPVRNHLFHIKADSVHLKNLHLQHSAGFSVLIENSNNSEVDQCIFEATHFAVGIANSKNTKVSNNLIRQKGFWERYSSDDIIGTRFEISTIHIDGGTDSSGSEIKSNIILGTPFFINPSQSSYSVHDNIAAYSCFGVWGAPRFANTAITQESRITVYNNIFHHMDLGLDIPQYFRFRGKMYIYRNYFYFSTENKWPVKDEKLPLFIENIYFYNNTVAFAGDGHMEIVPNPFKAELYFENNLYFAKNILFRYFVGASKGQYPLALTPQTGKNLYCGPLDGDSSFSEFTFKNEQYLYIKTDAKNRTIGTNNTKETKSQVFKNYYPLEDISFYENNFDPLKDASSASILSDTWERFFNIYWDLLVKRFQIDDKSVARNKGLKLQETFPDSFILGDETPDIGADENDIE